MRNFCEIGFAQRGETMFRIGERNGPPIVGTRLNRSIEKVCVVTRLFARKRVGRTERIRANFLHLYGRGRGGGEAGLLYRQSSATGNVYR